MPCCLGCLVGDYSLVPCAKSMEGQAGFVKDEGKAVGVAM